MNRLANRGIFGSSQSKTHLTDPIATGFFLAVAIASMLQVNATTRKTRQMPQRIWQDLLSHDASVILNICSGTSALLKRTFPRFV